MPESGSVDPTEPAAWSAHFTFVDMTDAEVGEIFDRLCDAVCGVEHDPDDDCPVGSWFASLRPIVFEE